MSSVQTPVAEPSAPQRSALNTILSSLDGVVALTGIRGSGKSTTVELIAREPALADRGVVLTRGDQLRMRFDEVANAGIAVIDDAHHVNGELLSELLGSRQSRGAATVIAWDALIEPIPASGIVEVRLEPWTHADLRRATLSWGFDIVDEDAIRRAGGNPGLLRWWLERAKPIDAGQSTPAHRLPLISSLTRKQIELLRAGTLVGDTFRIEVVAHGVILGWVELADLCSTLVGAGILRSKDAELEFAHPLLADELRRSITDSEKRSRSRAIAQTLLDTGEAPDAACLYLAAAQWYSHDILEWLTNSGSHLIDRRPEALVPLLEGFLEWMPGDHARRPELQTWLAQCLFQLGRASDVERLVQQSLKDGRAGAAEVPLRINLSGALLLGNNVVEALDVLGDTAPLDVVDERERNVLRAVRSLHQVFAGELVTGESEAIVAAETGRVIGDTLGMSVALSTLSHVAYYEGDFATAIEHATQAVEHADRSDSHEASRRTRYELGMFNLHADHVDEARYIFESEAQRSENDTASKWYRPLPLIGLGLLDHQLGNWHSAKLRLEDALRYGEEVSTRWESAYVRSHLADMAVKEGDITQAIAHLEHIEHRPDDTPHHSLDAVLWARATVATALNRSTEALDLLSEAAALVRQYGVVTRYRWLVPQVLRAARVLEKVEEFAWLVNELDSVARKSDVAYVHGASLLSRALLTSDRHHAAQAVDILRGTHRRTELADALSDAGALHADAGDTETAIRFLQEARDLYDSFGAGAAHAKAKAELRTLGVSSATSRRRRPPVTGPESLTPAERRIVGFVAQGLSNAQIAQKLYISPRTVETHLSRCYAKLGVASRVALAMVVTNRVR